MWQVFYLSEALHSYDPHTPPPLTHCILVYSLLGEEMNKLLASMDPQGLLNMADAEENTTSTGVDPTKSGDAHAAPHDVSLTDNGSESGSSAGSTREKSGNRSETMEVGSPRFRIVDIELRPGTQQFQVLPPPGPDAATDPAPAPVLALTANSMTLPSPSMETTAPVFAIPSIPASQEKQSKGIETITGKNIFSKPTVGEYRYPIPNPAKKFDQSAKIRTTAENSPNMQNIPTRVQAPQIKSLSLPTKKPDPVEPDAVPSKIYDAILL